MCVSVALGMASRRRFTITYAAIIFGIFQAAMPLLGYYLTRYVADAIAPELTGVISGVILAALGGKMVGEAIRGTTDASSKLISDRLPILLLLGVLTSIDALAVGVSFGCSCHDHIRWEAGIIGGITTAISAAAGFSAQIARHFLPTQLALGAGGAILVALGIFNSVGAVWK